MRESAGKITHCLHLVAFNEVSVEDVLVPMGKKDISSQGALNIVVRIKMTNIRQPWSIHTFYKESEPLVNLLCNNRLLQKNINALVGIEFIYEIISRGEKLHPIYVCILCKRGGNAIEIYEHIHKRFHLATYLKEKFPEKCY
jgi:hypothetical protein